MANANKKPAPAQPPSKSAPAKPAPDKADKQKGGGAAFWKLPAAKRLSVRLGNLATRIQNQAIDEIRNWPGVELVEVRSKLGLVLDELKSAAEDLAKLPDTYQPRAKGGGSKVELLPGSLIRITDKQMSFYEDILKPEEMRGLTYKETRGPKVVAVTNTGLLTLINRGHVCPDV
jgi:hypothetical protein